MKTAIVSGASSGIGKATTERLLQDGYFVCAIARRAERLTHLSEKWQDRILCMVCDVTDKEQVGLVVEKVLAERGRIDVLINNAGVGHLGPIMDASFDDWENMVNVNIIGLLSLIHSCLPALLKSNGHIINLASVAAHDVYPGSVVYCATKHAVNAITRGFRMEFRDKIKVTNISPGAVDTEFKDHTHHEAFKKQFEKYFDGNVILASDIADAIAHVLGLPDHLVVNEYIIRPNQ
jgi:NADP-dependent 3-hydroxy acid dehydrogenase YdfG